MGESTGCEVLGSGGGVVMGSVTGFLPNGWAKPDKSRVYHWFIDSMSICGKWSYYGPAARLIDGDGTLLVPMSKRCKSCVNHNTKESK